MMAYEDYEQECNRIREGNKAILKGFEDWLRAKGMSEKTIQTHVRNIDFYINVFLLYSEPKQPAEGTDEIDYFLGYWFIKKAMWSNEVSIKSNVASLKKFYEFMFEQGMVAAEALQEMKAVIKEGLPEWIETMRRYDDPSVDIEDVWGW